MFHIATIVNLVHIAIDILPANTANINYLILVATIINYVPIATAMNLVPIAIVTVLLLPKLNLFLLLLSFIILPLPLSLTLIISLVTVKNSFMIVQT